MIAQRPQVSRLAIGPGPDQPVPLANRQRRRQITLGAAHRRLDRVGHLARIDRPLPPIEPAKLLEDLARLRDAVGVPFDPDLAMSGQHLDPQRVAHLPKVLVSAAEDGKFLVVSFETDCCFRHASPFVDQHPASGLAPSATY